MEQSFSEAQVYENYSSVAKERWNLVHLVSNDLGQIQRGLF